MKANNCETTLWKIAYFNYNMGFMASQLYDVTTTPRNLLCSMYMLRIHFVCVYV